MEWTREQLDAITARGENILVSAAAGSGKTAVLVERIKRLIIEDGTPIDRMLIVTFTNAAAAEMKEKIRTAITRELKESREDAAGSGVTGFGAPSAAENFGVRKSHKKLLREQLALLPKANISTFHAFALEAIRRYFYLIDIEPNFKICDDAQKEIIKGEAMDKLLEMYFEEGNPQFFQFLKWYSSDRNEDRIREMIDYAYNNIMSLPNPWEWLHEQVERLKLNTKDFLDGKIGDFIAGFMEESLSLAVANLQDAQSLLGSKGLDRLAEKLTEEIETLALASEKARAKELQAVGQILDEYKAATIRATKEEKEDYDLIKDLVKEYRDEVKRLAVTGVKNTFFYDSFDNQIEEINKTYPMAAFFEKMLVDFHRLFTEGKKERNLIDFNDIEHYCLAVLSEEDASRYYRDKFDFVFIDEYQDTNLLQESIIAKVKRDNNLFMVGDIKQSIYKFRLAEPEIFKAKYEAYKTGETPLSRKIDLNRNYRSKGIILNSVNQVFEDLMDEYDEDAMLYEGMGYDGNLTYKPEMYVVNRADVTELDPELQNLKAAEYEALLVSDIIAQKLGTPYFDTKAQEQKTLELKDIVILMRSTKNYADVFYRTFRDKGIPAYVDDNEGYFDTMEINVFMNLLTVIDNKLQDIPLISVLRSEIFGFTIEELSAIRIAYSQGSYAKAFIQYAGICDGGAASENEEREVSPRAITDPIIDPALADKCRKVLEKINTWKEDAKAMTLDGFVWHLLLHSGYYVAMGAMPLGNQRQANLRALVDKAIAFRQSETGSLYNFMKYIEAIKKRKVTMGQVKLVGENDNLVRIMTIHKSKGLEFPMVILSGLGKGLNFSKASKGISIHKDIGIGMTLVNPKEHWHKNTLLQALIAKQIRREEASEEVRILYVAMTRPRDMLIMTGAVKDGEKYIAKNAGAVKGDTSFLAMLDYASLGGQMISAADVGKRSFDRTWIGSSDDQTEELTQRMRDDIRNEVNRRLSYVYPYEKALKLKSKFSVSELNHLAAEPVAAGGQTDSNHANESHNIFQIQLAVPNFMQGEKTMTAAMRGTIYHTIMERIDFVRASEEGLPYLQSAVAEYVDAGILLEEEAQAVGMERIQGFFSTDFGKRAVKAAKEGRLYREKPFDLVREIEGEQIIVQGIIDCFFEEGGKYILLDYKTNYIDKNKPLSEELDRIKNTYKKQMDIYGEAIRTIKSLEVAEAYLYLFDIGQMVDMK